MPVETTAVRPERLEAKEDDQKLEEPILQKREKPAALLAEESAEVVEAPETTKTTDSSSTITPAASATLNELPQPDPKDEEEVTKSVED